MTEILSCISVSLHNNHSPRQNKTRDYKPKLANPDLARGETVTMWMFRLVGDTSVHPQSK